jgi:hypothetical protein
MADQPPLAAPSQPSRTHVVFDELGEVLSYELAPSAEQLAEEARRGLAAMALTRHLDVYRSILSGRPVLARRLDGRVLRHALRGGPLPDPDAHLLVDEQMHDAVAEAGPLLDEKRRAS